MASDMASDSQHESRIENLIQLGIALSAERDHNKLLETILREAENLTNADAGTIYLINDEQELEFAIVHNETLGIHLGGTSGNEITFRTLKLFDPKTDKPLDKNVASYSAIHGETINIEDAYSEEDDFDFSGTRTVDARTRYHSQSFLTIPMKERQKGEVIGVLQLINAKNRQTGETEIFAEDDVAYVEALASQAAVAIDNQRLLVAQQTLMEAIIGLMAGAIDAKSPYTGGHCTRVPDIAQRLADAACDAKSGPFADFDMGEEERYEFYIGSWLHDCGKVTTPEYVVDKATKLETIYNRIHEIRTRFELLHRDAEIAYWKAVAGGGDEAKLKRQLDDSLTRIKDDFAFIAESNVGGEFMDPERQQRVRQIAGIKWTRHFDDRLGLAHDELDRYERTPAPELPIEENLLVDRDDHVIHRDGLNGKPFGDNRLGFNMRVPEHAYNRGEVYNLCIERGTLNDEERFKINDHIIQTIIMLDSLPWPKHLCQVPEFAGGHHEKMDGTGYPRGLKKDQMSVPARIMAIADIYEALTASDRPYKKAKTLSEALRIMGFMNKDEHIDGELFELFLKSGVYLDYAKEHLAKEQIDTVNPDDYLN